MNTPIELEIDKITPSPTNPRKHFNPAKLDELAESLKVQGLLQPLLVRPSGEAYELVAGERRWRAAKLAKLGTVTVIARDLSDAEVLEIQMIENLQRDDLTPLEEAAGYRKMLDLVDATGKAVFTVEVLAQRLSRARSTVFRHLSLLKLPPPVAAKVESGELPVATAILVARLPNDALRLEVAKKVLEPQYQDEVLSKRDTEDLIKEEYMLSLKGSAFDQKCAQLCPEAGSCTACPKRTGNDKEAFEGYLGNLCTDPACYRAKQDAHWAALEAKAAAGDASVKLISGKEAKKLFPHGEHWMDSARYVKLADKPSYGELRRSVEREKVPTYKKLLANTGIPTALVRLPESGKVVEVVEAKLAITAAAEAYPDLFKEPSEGIFQDKQKEKAERERAREAEKLELEISYKLMGTLCTGISQHKQPPARFWKLLVELVLEMVGCGGLTFVCYRNSLDVKEAKQDGALYPEQTAVHRMLLMTSADQIPARLLELLVADAVVREGAAANCLAPFLDLYGVDVKAIGEAVKAEFKESAALKKKAAKKAAPKGKPAADKAGKPAAKKQAVKQSAKKTPAKQTAKKPAKKKAAKQRPAATTPNA